MFLMLAPFQILIINNIVLTVQQTFIRVSAKLIQSNCLMKAGRETLQNCLIRSCSEGSTPNFAQVF